MYKLGTLYIMTFNGDELADIIAFVHNADEQKKFSRADILPKIVKLIGHLDNESNEHETKGHGEDKGMMMRVKKIA